ncbi:helix-turn-helix transcriptional regulator [Paenibacillus sp. CH40]|uniref:helix-turn-helix domain-containing protein n=1 Tax=Paenibacillus sp. CH40 TaxID=2962045 RepID=UPI0020B886A3|nr:helix-turn-helix transcriptional regulator [Paenibacillus sp. CH40]MCP3794709.1 helix-turn-helix transcriptional regulator [Paenibacillus sp. CH40]
MKDNDLILSDLAREAEMNPGTMSSIINGNRTLSVDQLDRITKAMGHTVGYYYERYVSEYLTEANPNWRRMSPFIHNCAKLNKLDCIHDVVNLLMDKLGYSESLFELAEELFHEKMYQAAAILYENVALSEKKQYSERLAMCQYRLFHTRQGDNQEKNYEAAVQFEIYVERLDEIDQLEALKDLANTYRSLRKWDKVELFAKALGDKAKIQYKLEQQRHHVKKENSKKPSFPLFAYWAFSHLLRAEACEARKDYEQALQHTYAYADLSWVKDTDETALKWKRQYEEWAVGNTYLNKILAGEINVLSDYVVYISSRKDEILPALDIIVDSANRYHIDVDDILKQFNEDISSFLEQQKVESFYTRRFITERFMHFSKELSVYYLTKGRFSDGFKFLISCLEKSTLINNKSYIIKCMRLYESYREHASTEIKTAYRNLINEVEKDET